MNVEEKKLINKMCAILMIIALTISDFLFVGKSVVSYAIDMVSTNNNNVEFVAYFKNENEEKLDTKEIEVGKKATLYVDIAVKNEGYFNGKIILKNSNFKIVKEMSTSGFVSSIQEDEVTLNQINAGAIVTIALEVENKESSVTSIEMLNNKTSVCLEGSYVNSKNVESKKYVDIKGTSTVYYNIISKVDIAPRLEIKVLTNSPFVIDKERKNLVQLEVKSKLADNNYPVKNTKIELDVPSEVQDVEVFARSTNATNSNLKFNNDNYIYNKEEGKLIISVDNKDENNIDWQKNAEDVFIITYISDNEITSKVINAVSTLQIYDGQEVKTQNFVHIEEKIDGIITLNVTPEEQEIYKGKIYTGEEREYEVTTSVNVNYLGIVDRLNIVEKGSTFNKEASNIDANVIYKKMLINKDEFINLFGENGYIHIKSGEEILFTINKETETNENGQIVVNFENNRSKVTLETSMPEAKGTLNIKYVKAIMDCGLSRDDVNKISSLNNIVEYYYNNTIKRENSDIVLKNTSTSANFDVDTNVLTSKEESKDVKITITLNNNDESKDLYKNPTFIITLPNQVDVNKAGCSLLHSNGLKFESAKVISQGNKKAIEVKLSGEQVKYNSENINGTTLIVNANISVAKSGTSSEEEIKLSYTNENALTYLDNGEKSAKVKVDIEPQEEQKNEEEENKEDAPIIDSKAEIVATLKAYVGGKEVKENDPIYKGEVITYVLSLKNNGENDAKNINIKTVIPENTTLVEYDKSFNEFHDEEIHSTMRLDKYNELKQLSKDIILLNKKEEVKINYDVRIDEVIPQKSLTVQNEITYLESNDKTNTITVNKEIANIQDSELTANIYMFARNDNIYEGTDCNYKIVIRNNTQNTLSNVKVKVNSSNIKINKAYDFAFNSVELNNGEFNIDKIEAGKEVRYYISGLLLDNINEVKVSALINNKYRTNEIIDNVTLYQLTAELASKKAGQTILDDEDVVYHISIKNTGKEKIDSLEVVQKVSTFFDIESVKLNNKEVKYTVYSDDSEEESKVDGDYIYSTYKLISIDMKDVVILPNEVCDIEVNVKEDNTIPHEQSVYVVSNAEVRTVEKVVKTNEINNIILPKNSTNSNQESSNGSKDENNNIQENKGNIISGVVWLDENKNGKKDYNEKTLSQIEVLLINIDDNSIQKTKSSNNGFYSFTNLKNGKYIVAFNYDKEKYNLTAYKQDGVDESDNSNVEKISFKLEGKDELIAATDTLVINSNNIANINLGLVEKKVFDLELSKKISKVVVSNNHETKSIEYNDTDLAKVEIKSKYLEGSLVVIEYKIKVTNTGDVAGYAKNIVDYKPADLVFNSSMNPNWYQSGENLYTTSLANEKLEPGETKEISLILTKTMTASNTGLVNNIAELSEVQNDAGMQDKDSTTANKNLKEDDIGSANIIISVSTGMVVSYILITLSLIVIIAVGAYLINKKILINKI